MKIVIRSGKVKTKIVWLNREVGEINTDASKDQFRNVSISRGSMATFKSRNGNDLSEERAGGLKLTTHIDLGLL